MYDKEEAAGLSRRTEGVLFHDGDAIQAFLYKGEEDGLPRLAASGEDEGVMDGKLVEHPPDRSPLYVGPLVGIGHEGLFVLMHQGLKGFLIGNQMDSLALQGRRSLRQRARSIEGGWVKGGAQSSSHITEGSSDRNRLRGFHSNRVDEINSLV